MEYRTLGRSGITVSRLCLGAMMFGGPTDAAASARIIARAAEAGFTFLDTADVYNGGRSEEIVGEILGADRGGWIIATKLGNAMGRSPNMAGLSRRWIQQAVEGSLRRLRSDAIDLLYLHREDPATPLETTVAALADVIRAGKVRQIGLSNFRAWRMAEFCRLCDQAGIDRPVVTQPLYNALNRQAEVEQIPAAMHYGLAVFPYSPLARGVLTAKYAPGAEPAPDSRAARKDKRLLETELRAESLEIAQAIRTHAEARGIAPSHFALQWVPRNPGVTGCVVGPRTTAQLEDYIAALAAGWGAEDEELVDRLVSPGHPSTPGYNDP
jgi:aryl-alcohol dehydrogenase-like predicted oxidoreductase